MLKHQIAVFTTENALIEKARALSETLCVPFIFGIENDEAAQSDFQFLLIVTRNFLVLQKRTSQQFKSRPSFYIDFLSKQMRNRVKQRGLRSEFLARAIGIHPRDKPYIVDATAGLGRDSFMLASLGFEVTMLEISPILFVLLKDALTRGSFDEIVSPIVGRMHLIHTDAITWLKNHASKPSDYPDVIYLDPMFPTSKKKAAVKKEMAFLQELLKNCQENARTLHELALTCTKERVVVKRPRLALPLSEQTPDFSITGKSSRFDVYLTKKRL